MGQSRLFACLLVVVLSCCLIYFGRDAGVNVLGRDGPPPRESVMQIMLSSAEGSSDADESAVEEMDYVNENDDPVATQIHVDEMPVVNELGITRRRNDFGVVTAETPLPHQPAARSRNIRNIAAAQSLFTQHARSAAELYPKSLWRMLQAVQLESKATQSKVLKACTTFLPIKKRKEWPLTRQAVNTRLAK